jgi:glycine/D-amino acid oxidase-like deaminating enzyme
LNRAHYDVGIIGGGLAGLVCASTLAQFGVRSVVLEGSNRLGGRLETMDWHGSRIELGAKAVPHAATEFRNVIERMGLAGDLTPARGGSGAAFHGDEGRVLCTAKDIQIEGLSRREQSQSALYLLKALDLRRTDPDREQALHARSFAEDTEAHCGPLAKQRFFTPLAMALVFTKPEQLSAMAMHRSLPLLLSPLDELAGGFASLIDALASSLQGTAKIETGVEVNALEPRRVGYRIHAAQPAESEFEVNQLVCALPLHRSSKLLAPLGIQIPALPFRMVHQEFARGQLRPDLADSHLNLVVNSRYPHGVGVQRIEEDLFKLQWVDDCGFALIADRIMHPGFESAGFCKEPLPLLPILGPGCALPSVRTERSNVFLCGDFDWMRGVESCAATAKIAAQFAMRALEGPSKAEI